jgi:hypothetical protein
MKKLLLIVTILSFVACSSGNLEVSPAVEKVESLIKVIDKEKYKEASEYYTEQFNSSESFEARSAKFKQLKDVLGNIVEIKLVDTLMNENSGEEASLSLTYRIKHDRLTTVEVFTVVKEEGKYKVSGQSIKSTEN